MRIVIDLQGAQTESRFRGIGRYSMALAMGIARNAGAHEIWLALNAAHPESVLSIRRAFEGLIPQERIRVFDPLSPAPEQDIDNAWRNRASERIREYFIQSLKPDAVLVTSLFEGYDAVTSVGEFSDPSNTAAILYDLIPLLNPEGYLANPADKQYYYRKLEWLKKCGLLLSISDYSRQEGIQTLDLRPENVVSISTAADSHFKPVSISLRETENLLQRFNVTRKMVMYAPGGFDPRKNIDSLIIAYSLLPKALRAEHQLVIVSKLRDFHREQLINIGKSAGLNADELVLTGYVSEADLHALYNAATLFVIPSKHEGFGLPALEAMSCGAPVIGSDSTSIPEVIGRVDALFDASSPQSIAEKIQHVLQDDAFRDQLRQHGLVQCKKFSWDESAKRALRALERFMPAKQIDPIGDSTALGVSGDRKPRLAFLSPLPPARAGIADYAAELLPELVNHYDIELITDEPNVTLPASLSELPRRSIEWFAENGKLYDRILYQFGNSTFHSHMFQLLEKHPGVVVLHDFYLSGVLAHDELQGNAPNVFVDSLYHSHGYPALQARYAENGIDAARRTYPCNLRVLQNARATIVHSTHSQMMARRWYGERADADWTKIPLLRIPPQIIDRDASRKALGIGDNKFLVCSFGLADPTKLSHRLVEAWLASSFSTNPDCELVLVGANHGADYGAQLAKRIHEAGQGRIRITGWVDQTTYQQYLCAADLGVQLRTMSRGETSAAVLDCMNYGLPAIVNANGSMAEFPDDCVWKLPDAFSDQELIFALESLWSNRTRRNNLGASAKQFVHSQHHPSRCAQLYTQAIERAYGRTEVCIDALVDSIASIPGIPANEDGQFQLAQHIAASSTFSPSPRQLLVDVSAISRTDLRTGIERVTRAQLLELLRGSPSDFRVEPIYLTHEGGTWHYRYARQYVKKLLGIEAAPLNDAPVDINASDVFYSSDFYPAGVIEAARSGIYTDWKARGVEINFTVFDLLPVLRPEFFPAEADRLHAEWLECVARHANRLICISHAVADEARRWLEQSGKVDLGQLTITAAPLGADIEASSPSKGMPSDAQRTLRKIAAVPSFLMVGTIEPRKGHLQTLAAFEQLWKEGSKIQLVIVGKEGWTSLEREHRRTIPNIVERLSTHPELGRRLFWLQNISDEYLQKTYAASVCLIAASEGEGFGLPLIEAAQFKLPIIARDIPVFREVAQQHAFYFKGLDAEDIANAVRTWLLLRAKGEAPASTGMQWNTWADNAAEILTILLRLRVEQEPGERIPVSSSPVEAVAGAI